MEELKFMKVHAVGGKHVDPRFGVTWYNEWMKPIGNYKYKCTLCDYVGQIKWGVHPDVSRMLVKNHIIEHHFVRIIFKQRRESVLHLHLHPLKPWNDPESLYCSPKLKDIINKEPLSGNECGGRRKAQRSDKS